MVTESEGELTTALSLRFPRSTFYRTSSAPSTDVKQEKLEGVIELPEDLEVTKSILSFLYTTSYTEDGTSPLQHSAGVYFAAAKYDIPALKTLASSKVASLFRSLETEVEPDTGEPLSLEATTCVEKFLELVVEVYDKTEDIDDLRSETVSTAREILRTTQHTAQCNDAWVKCFELAPAFALDLVKSESISPDLDVIDAERIIESRKWRAARDCVIRECQVCDTAVTISKDRLRLAGFRGFVFDEKTKCPVEPCSGFLTYKIQNC